MNIVKIITLFALIIMVGACTASNGQYAILSTKDISPYSINQTNTVVAENVSAVDSRHVIVVVPSSRAPTIGIAIDELLDKYDGDYLANAQVNYNSFSLLWAYHYTAWEITGDVVKLYQ